MQAWWFIAKAGDLPKLMEVVVPLIMVLIYIVNSIVNRERKGAAGKPRPAPRRPPMPDASAKRPVAPGQPGQKPDPLLAEIQKFLKQANPEKRPPARSAGTSSKPIRAEVVRPHSEPPIRDSGGRPLDKRRLDTDEFNVRASQMDDEMKRADAEREEHFQQTFAHRVGRLADTSSGGKGAPAELPAVTAASAAAAASPATTVAGAWLPLPSTQPEELRRAFMLNEILQRPEHRW